jgi:four helix bundle protein
VQDYHNLLVWKKAHALAIGVHDLTRTWSRGEHVSLIGQMRRSSLSIPSNVAEGAGRGSAKEFAKFVQIAIASSSELEYQLEFARDTRALQSKAHTVFAERVIEVRRMLFGLLKRLRSDPPS